MSISHDDAAEIIVRLKKCVEWSQETGDAVPISEAIRCVADQTETGPYTDEDLAHLLKGMRRSDAEASPDTKS